MHKEGSAFAVALFGKFVGAVMAELFAGVGFGRAARYGRQDYRRKMDAQRGCDDRIDQSPPGSGNNETGGSGEFYHQAAQLATNRHIEGNEH